MNTGMWGDGPLSDHCTVELKSGLKVDVER